MSYYKVEAERRQNKCPLHVRYKPYFPIFCKSKMNRRASFFPPSRRFLIKLPTASRVGTALRLHIFLTRKKSFGDIHPEALDCTMFAFFCDMRQKQSRLRRKPPLIRRVREDALRVCEADGFRFVPAKADPARARGSFHTKRYADLSRLHVNMGHRDTSLLRALDEYVRNLPRRSKLFLQLMSENHYRQNCCATLRIYTVFVSRRKKCPRGCEKS